MLRIEVFALLRDAFQEWQRDKAQRLGAALACYTMLALVPLLILFLVIAGQVLGPELAQGEMFQQARRLVGIEGAAALLTLLESTRSLRSGLALPIFSVLGLVIGAMTVFNQLEDALNSIWKVEPRPGRSIRKLIRVRVLSFLMVLGIGGFLVVSFVFDTLLAAFGRTLLYLFPHVTHTYILRTANWSLWFGIFVVLFAVIYKVLPDVQIAWGDVWLGAILTSLLFISGQFVIGLYLSHSRIGSASGVLGSLLIVFFWVYLSAQLFFFGAELTYVYARNHHAAIVPTDQAVRVIEENRVDLERPTTMRRGQQLAIWLRRPIARASVLVPRFSRKPGRVLPGVGAMRAPGETEAEQPAINSPVKRQFLTRFAVAMFGFLVGLLVGQWRHK